MKPFLITFFAIVMMAMTAVAQAPQEVTLTVSSDGPTKEDATKNALRSAIEQAFGAFVSANTTILNDELVKDEIVTVSNGSIKDYKEVSAVQTDNGTHFVTLTATVSLPNLITYAKSHGSECEFAGNTFAMNEKIKDLQYENAQKVLENLKTVIINTPDLFDYELELGEPCLGVKETYMVNGNIKVSANNNTLNIINLIHNTIVDLCKQLDPERVESLNDRRNYIRLPILDRRCERDGQSEYWFDGCKQLTEIAQNIQLNDNISSPSSLETDIRLWSGYFF